jgi:hypothetical protein
MARQQEFWTYARIQRLVRILRHLQGEAIVDGFLARLAPRQSLEEKQALIKDGLLPLLRFDVSVTQLWEGHEREIRFLLRDLVQQFLHDEHVVENTPTNTPDTPEEEAELQRLGRLLGQGKSGAEAVIEDRGPR